WAKSGAVTVVSTSITPSHQERPPECRPYRTLNHTQSKWPWRQLKWGMADDSPTAPHRYSRQMLFAPLGAAGQRKLAEARVAVVGCGALGTAQADLLARAGIGHLHLIDRDYVEASNLQRQTLFDESDAAASLPKATAAA